MTYADRDLSANQPTSAMNATNTITLTSGLWLIPLRTNPITAISASSPNANMLRPYALSAPSVNGMDSTDARKLSILAYMGES